MTKKLTDKQKSKRSRIREFRKADPKGLGPYNIIWESKDPRGTAHVKLDPKDREIHIPEKFTKDRPADEEYYGTDTGAVLAHEIAHTRTLYPSTEWPEHITDEDFDKGYEERVYVWRELEAVLYQLAKDWELERWVLLSELHDAAAYLGSDFPYSVGSLKDAKVIARKMLEHQWGRGHITRDEFSRAIKEIDAIEKTEWDQYEGTYQYVPKS